MEKRKLNDKGFSLVELIIVIAIMAVLIAVLAPQYLRYVERSRVSADAATIDQYVSAMQVAASDEEITLSTTADYSVDVTGSTGAIAVSADLQPILANFDIPATGEVTSTTYRTDFEIVLEFDATNSIWTVDTSGIPTP